jgi:O-antigen/teichoic acid export membrane protein
MPMGTHNILIRFFPSFEDRSKDHHGFFLYAMLLPLIGAAIVTSLVLLFQGRIEAAYAEKSSRFLEYLPYVIFLALIITYQKVFMAYSRSLLQAFLPNFLRQVVVRILTMLAVLLYFFSFYDFEGMLRTYLLAYASLILVMIVYVGGKGQLRVNPSSFRIPWKKGLEMAQYGLYVMVTSASNLLSRNIDTLMLGAIVGLSNTGIYTISYFVGSLIELPKRALSQISAPMLAKAREKEDMKEIQKIYEKSSVNNFLVGSFLFLCVWTNIEELFDIIPNGETYQKGVTVVLFIAAARSIDLLTGLTGQIIVTSRFFRVNLWAMLLLIVSVVVLNYFLIPIYGMEGAAFATFMAMVLSEGVKVTFLWYREGLFPFSIDTLKTILVLGVVYFASTSIPLLHDPWTTILVRCITIAILFGGLAYLLKISEDANELIEEKIRGFRG